MGRCKSPNLCPYCGRLAAMENAEMLALDALDGRGPEIYAVLTTRSEMPSQADHERGRHEFVRRLRRDFGREVEFSSHLEFSTGRGELAGGKRRPHWNYLIKGIRPTEQNLEHIRRIIGETWCQIEDAEPQAQHVGSVYSAGGLMKYLTLHFAKEDQRPPDGWRGQRFNCSHGYFRGSTRRTARQRARESICWKRALWRVQQTGRPGDDAHRYADEQLEDSSGYVWSVCSMAGGLLLPRVFDPRSLPERIRKPLAFPYRKKRR